MTRLEEDVLRLDIAVDDVACVGIGQGVTDLAGETEGFVEGKGLLAGHAGAEGFALDEGHDVVKQS